MVSECFEGLIERPSGISGYRPTSWCSVCGRTASLQEVKKCATQGCPNLSHVACLGEETEYRCGNTGQLRVKAGINDPVTAYKRDTQNAHPPHSLDITQDAPVLDDLGDLNREELKQIINNLRRDLTSTKSQLNNHGCIKDYLIDRRRTLVEELSTVDTLIATLTFEEKHQRSIACTAKQHNIEAECAAASHDRREENPPPPQARSSQPSSSSDTPNTSSPPPSSSPSHPASSQSTLAETETTTRGDTATYTANDESEAARQQSSQQGTQRGGRQRRQPRRNRGPAPRETPPHQRSQQQVSSSRQQQDRCQQCRRHGHTQDQCPRKACEYCQGRFHSSQNCRVKIADERQQELIQAVRQANQETLSALRGVTWNLRHPPAQQRVEPTLVAPPGQPVPRSPWPLTPHPLPFQYGAAPRHFPATLHAYQ